MSKKKKIDTRHMFHLVCHLNIISVRLKPTDDDILVSQLLFGETAMILEKKNKHWIKIKSNACGSIGWVKTSQITLIDESLFEKLNTNSAMTIEICHPVFNEEITKNIVIGSCLPCYDGISCSMPGSKFVYNGQATSGSGMEYSAEILIKIARRYLYSPELRGGRSPFGIDAGALIQQIFRFFNILLPRQPYEQYTFGEIIDFVELAKEGDLAFCMDDNQQISHVGMVISEKKVLHIYGEVRIDKLDHHGFYNKDLRKYTHKLRIIKRIV